VLGRRACSELKQLADQRIDLNTDVTHPGQSRSWSR
jgi:hypothetical protein